MKDNRTPFTFSFLTGLRRSTQFLSPPSSPPSVFLVFLLYSLTQYFLCIAPPNSVLGMQASSPMSIPKLEAYVKAVLFPPISSTSSFLIYSTTLNPLTPHNSASFLELSISRPPCGTWSTQTTRLSCLTLLNRSQGSFIYFSPRLIPVISPSTLISVPISVYIQTRGSSFRHLFPLLVIVHAVMVILTLLHLFLFLMKLSIWVCFWILSPTTEKMFLIVLLRPCRPPNSFDLY